MKQNRNFVTTAVVALFATGAYAACSVSPNLAGEAAVTAAKSGEGVPYNPVSAARSAERSFEHREPPPKHLVARRSCKDLELERPVAG